MTEVTVISCQRRTNITDRKQMHHTQSQAAYDVPALLERVNREPPHTSHRNLRAIFFFQPPPSCCQLLLRPAAGRPTRLKKNTRRNFLSLAKHTHTLSGMTRISMLGSESNTDLSVRDWYRILSRASLELEMSSRRKICFKKENERERLVGERVKILHSREPRILFFGWVAHPNTRIPLAKQTLLQQEAQRGACTATHRRNGTRACPAKELASRGTAPTSGASALLPALF